MAAVHKITPSNPRLHSLLTEVESGNIKIPVFQRAFVWNDEQIMSLLDSIYNGYPVGSILLWSTKEELDSHRDVGGFRLPDTPADYPVKYVLDGQQRLTTLYAVFHSNEPAADAELASRFDVAFSPGDGTFVPASQADPATTINMRSILDATKLLAELGRFAKPEQDAIASLQERFKDYEFPVVTIKERTNQEVCRIFQRINSSGTSLSTLDLLAAWTWSDSFDLRQQIEELQSRLASKGFEELQETQIMRCLAAVVLGGVGTDGLVDADPNDLVEGMDTVKQAINAAVDFLANEFHIRNYVFVPFPIMLVPLVYFFSKKLNPSAAQRKALKRWFWHCSFTQRYRAGTNKQVQEDLDTMKRLAEDPSAFDHLDAHVDPELFLKTWRINSTVAKATICLLAQMHPKSFMSGQAVDLGTALEAYNSREFHHIYPKAYLNGLGIQFHEANVIANVCMLTSVDNKQISDRPPHEYFKDIPDDLKQLILDRAVIPSEHRDGSFPYKEFVKARSKALAATASMVIERGSLE